MTAIPLGSPAETLGGAIGLWAGRVIGGAIGELAGPEAVPLGVIVGGKVGQWAGAAAGAYLASKMTDANQKVEKKTKAADTTASSASCPPPSEEEEKKRKQDAKDAKRMSPNELEKAAKNNDYDNAHKLKDDFGLNSKSDIFVDKNGEMYSGPAQGVGDNNPLFLNKNGGRSGLLPPEECRPNS